MTSGRDVGGAPGSTIKGGDQAARPVRDQERRPAGSALRKKINETLLDITADGTYDELYSKYFGDANSG
ncbi:MAG TPA: transporter substrate-binding domain-containing protein [Pseudonocardiaceae bacterium]